MEKYFNIKIFRLTDRGQTLLDFMIIAFLMATIIHIAFDIYQSAYEIIESEQWKN